MVVLFKQQRPMPCLCDVMDFFVNVVGPSAVPLTTVVGRDVLAMTPLLSASPSHSEQTGNDVDMVAPEVSAALM